MATRRKQIMGLCITMNRGDYVMIGDVKMTYSEKYKSQQIRLVFDGPKEIKILRMSKKDEQHKMLENSNTIAHSVNMEITRGYTNEDERGNDKSS
jgi:hypothetical protein